MLAATRQAALARAAKSHTEGANDLVTIDVEALRQEAHNRRMCEAMRAITMGSAS